MKRVQLAAILGAVVAIVAGSGVYFGFLRKGVITGPIVEPPVAPIRVEIPVPPVGFTDVTKEAGIAFRHVNGATGQKLLPETMGGGVAVLDYDGDGKQDLLFVSGCPWPGADASSEAKAAPCLTLYRNKGDGTFDDVTRAAGLDVTMYGMGVCVGDIDNDGFPDVFVTGVGGHRLFQNVAVKGGRGFADVTGPAGITVAGSWPGAASASEFTGYQPPIAFGSSATFLDYDLDGKLDLFVCHYVTWSPAIDISITPTLTGGGRSYQQPQSLEGSQCRLYRNAGGGQFTDVTEAAGVKVVEKEGTAADARERPVAKSLAVVSCDPDGDGWPDVAVANDTVRNFYFRNVPVPGGRAFREVGQDVNAAYADGRARGAMGIDFAEYKPGANGLVIANFAQEPCTFLTPTASDGQVRFTNKALAVGLEGQASRAPLKFGAFFFDYDLDGRLDLLLCNGHLEPEISQIQPGQEYQQPAQLFWNTGGDARLQFEPVPAAVAGKGLSEPMVGRGSAYLDYDGDGDLDVVLVENNGPARLLRNDNKLGNQWVRLTLAGDGTTSNRSAIGAQVTIEAGGRTFKREVAGARGYLSQSEFPITVGLGGTATVDKVTVRWPGRDAGPPQVWTGLAAGRGYTLRQGAAGAE